MQGLKHVDRKPHPRDAWCYENSLFLAFPQYPVDDRGPQRHTSTLGPVPASDEFGYLTIKGSFKQVVSCNFTTVACILFSDFTTTRLEFENLDQLARGLNHKQGCISFARNLCGFLLCFWAL